MSNVIEQKQQHVEVIAEQIKNSVSTVLVDYRGLTVSQVTELRKQLRDAGIEFKVYKNTMVRRAADSQGLSELNEFLVGPSAIAFSNEDVIAPAKIIHEFSKKHEALEIKAGVIEGSFVPAEDVKSIASLPSRDGLLSMLLSVLQAPVRNFAYAVKAIGEKEEQENGEA
jgi:large subunit ribosomal protein L10